MINTRERLIISGHLNRMRMFLRAEEKPFINFYNSTFVENHRALTEARKRRNRVGPTADYGGWAKFTVHLYFREHLESEVLHQVVLFIGRDLKIAVTDEIREPLSSLILEFALRRNKLHLYPDNILSRYNFTIPRPVFISPKIYLAA